MKRNLKQLCATNYAYAKKGKEETENDLRSLGLLEAFEFQSYYKTKSNFLQAVKKLDTLNALFALIEAESKLKERVDKLVRSGCTSEKLETAKKAKEGAKNAIEKVIGTVEEWSR